MLVEPLNLVSSRTEPAAPPQFQKWQQSALGDPKVFSQISAQFGLQGLLQVNVRFRVVPGQAATANLGWEANVIGSL